jgi:hypothetical protein
VLHQAPSNTPGREFLPYIGDYIRLLAVGRDFYGVFSGNNTPDMANFPSGVTYQRNANFNTHILLNTDGVTPVAVSIDPFFFKVIVDIRAWDLTVLPVVLDQLYQQVLERQVDPVGLIGWGCLLSRGEQSMRDVVRNIGHSQEYHDRFIAPLTTADAVRACYRHFLAREADPGGLQFWEGVATQQGFLPVIDGIVGSDEYTNKFGDDQVPH